MDEWSDLVSRAAEVGVRVAAATLLFVLFVLVGRVARPLVRLILERKRRPSYTRVMLGLYRVVIAVVGALVALTVTFPSVRVADVLAIFGIVSVAAGFAFRDTFESLLAGVLLIWRDPFQSMSELSVANVAPPPVALIRSVAAEGIAVECRMWTGPTSNEIAVARDQGIEAVLAIFHEHHIPMAVSELRIVTAAASQPLGDGRVV